MNSIITIVTPHDDDSPPLIFVLFLGRPPKSSSRDWAYLNTFYDGIPSRSPTGTRPYATFVAVSSEERLRFRVSDGRIIIRPAGVGLRIFRWILDGSSSLASADQENKQAKYQSAP